MRAARLALWLGLCHVIICFPERTNNGQKDNENLAKDKHGRIMMGVKHVGCDDGQWNLQIDWDQSHDLQYSYTCQQKELQQLAKQRYGRDEEDTIFSQLEGVKEECKDQSSIPMPQHVCMNEPIHYPDPPPTAGSHRPLWPAFGEYRYLPTTRWVHALEHGAAVFLYHPCADPVGIEMMKIMAKSCLWKHLITPYRNMKQEFAVITYGCRLMMNHFDPMEIYKFIKKHALVDSPETTVKNGTFVAELLEAADIVPGSNQYDKCICPYWSADRFSVEGYMSWQAEVVRNLKERRTGKNVKRKLRFGKDINIVKSGGCPL